MKKINVMAAAAIVTLATFSSCSKDPGTDPANEFNKVKFQVTYATDAQSRADGALVANDESLVMKTGHIFFTDAGGRIVEHVRIVSNAGDGAPLKEVLLTDIAPTAREAVVIDVPGTAVACHILSNDVAASMSGITVTGTGMTGQNISAVLSLAATVNNLNAASDVSAVPLYGTGNIVAQSGTTTVNNRPYEATVNVKINAVGGRLQIKEISSATYAYTDDQGRSQNITIGDFTVEAIYINNYYPTTTVGAWNGATGNPVNNGSDLAKYAITGTTDYASPSGQARKLVDELNRTSASGALKPNTANGGWVYNVFPTANGVQANVPHIIVKFSEVKYTDSGNAAAGEQTIEDQFITIAKYKLSTGGTVVNEIASTNIYTFGDIEFNFGNLSPLPEADKLDVLVTVEMMKWKDNSVVWDI
jgi:hypothetical protein